MLYGRTTTNLPSRFVDELPAESVKRVGAPKPSYSQQAPRQYGSFGRVSIYGDEYNDFFADPHAAEAAEGLFRPHAAEAGPEGQLRGRGRWCSTRHLAGA